MFKSYQKVKGMAGYILIFDSNNLILAECAPFKSKRKVIEGENVIVSSRIIIEHASKRIRVVDTDIDDP